jgi:hypothetical protein
VALAAAHGVDVRHAAHMHAPPSKRDVVRKLFQDGRTAHVLVPPSDMRARASETRSNEPPEWGPADLALAAKDVPPLAFAAACYAFMGDKSEYWRLWGALESEAHRLRERRGWSAQVMGADGRPKFYLSEISQLVLDEDSYQYLFHAAPVLYSAYIGVTEKIWRNVVFERFDAVKMCFLSWLERARGTIEHRLREAADDHDS